MSSRTPTESNLTTGALSALRWTYLGFVAQITCSFIAVTLLARVLGPKPFGQVAVAALVFGLANHLADAGLGSALLQTEELTKRQIRFAFTAQVLIGVVMMAGAIASAPLLALIFHDAAIRDIICKLSPIFVLQAFGQVSTALLKRRLAFRSVQRAQIASYVFGYFGVGLPAAYLGAGVWCLVAAQLTQSITYSVMVYATERHSIVPCIDITSVGLVWFGAKVTGANVLNWAIDNLDNFFVGRSFGPASLGLYSRAFNLAGIAPSGIASACQQVLFATASRAQTEPVRLRRAYLAVLGAIAVLTLPLLWSMAACAQTIVVGLYGTQWKDASILFTPLALAFSFNALMAQAGPVLAATDHVEQEVRTQALSGAFAAIAFAVAANYSVAAVAWAVLLVYVVRFYICTAPALRLLEIEWRDVWRVTRGPIAVGMLTSFVVVAVNSVAVRSGIQPIWILPMLAVTGGLMIYGVLNLAAGQVLPEELVSLLMNASGRLPTMAISILEKAASRHARGKSRRHVITESIDESDPLDAATMSPSGAKDSSCNVTNAALLVPGRSDD